MGIMLNPQGSRDGSRDGIVVTTVREGEYLEQEVVEPGRRLGQPHVPRLDDGAHGFEAHDLVPVGAHRDRPNLADGLQ